MNKICTSLEQSKKLIELGIDVDTADMYYQYFKSYSPSNGVTTGHCDIPIIGSWKEHHISIPDPAMNNADIPAWSLTALLELMPKLYEFENDPEDGGCQPNLCKGWDNNQWHIVYRSSIYITEWYDDPIDAAFQMVCWLLESHHI